MANKSKLKQAFSIDSIFGAFYTGGTVAWTADGQNLICQNGSKINSVSVDGNLTKEIIGATEEEITEINDDIYTFALNHDDSRIVTSHKSGLLKLWNVSDGEFQKQWKAIHQGPIPKLTFNSDDKLIASGGADSNIRLWDYEQKVCLGTLRGCQGVICVLAFHHGGDNEIVVAAGDDNSINCWELKTKVLKFTLKGHFTTITSISFERTGEFLVSAGRDKVLILWNLKTGTQVRTVPTYESLEGVVILKPNSESKFPDGVVFDENNVYAASAGENGNVRIWNMTKGQTVYEQEECIAAQTKGASLNITRLLFNEKCSQLALVTADHNIFIHNLRTFFCAKQLIGFADEILELTFFGKTGKYIAVATNSLAIKVYETSTMNCQILNGHTDIVLSLASHKNLLLSSGKDMTIRLWQIDSSNFKIKLIGIGTKHTSSVGSVAFGKLSHQICASVSQDTCLKVWTLPKDLNTASASDPINMNCIQTKIAHEKDVNCVVISPNDKLIATGSQDKTAKLWDATTLQLVGVFRGHKRGVWCVRFSPVDQILLTTSADCTIRLWSLTNMSCLQTFEGHESSILKAEFITKGLQILSTGSDGLIKLWNKTSSECVTTLDKHDGRIWALAISHDEQLFYSGGSDSQMIRWKDVTDEIKAENQQIQQDVILKEQELSNLLSNKKLLKALSLALRLDKPLISLRIINEIIRKKEDGALMNVICKLDTTNKEALLKHASNWNTNSRNCRPAQLVIQLLIREITSGQFRPKGMVNLVEELLPYTERHFKRMTQYKKDMKFLEFTLQCMQSHL